MKSRKHSRLQSFLFAINGLKKIIVQEPNFRLQIILMLIAFVAAWFFQCSANEWVAIVICSAFVLFAEAVNTVFEELVDWIHPQHHEKAGKIKDMAAALPLVAALCSVVVASIIFIPKMINWLRLLF